MTCTKGRRSGPIELEINYTSFKKKRLIIHARMHGVRKANKTLGNCCVPFNSSACCGVRQVKRPFSKTRSRPVKRNEGSSSQEKWDILVMNVKGSLGEQ